MDDDRLPRETVKEMLQRRRKEYQQLEEELEKLKEVAVEDPYENAAAAGSLTRKRTGFVYDESLLDHKCEWDPDYPENPSRLSVPYEKLKSLGIIEKCTQVSTEIRSDIKQRILKAHSIAHYERLAKICAQTEVEALERDASDYDAVYFNQATNECAHRSLSMFLNLIEAVAKDEVQNGFALIRPPGHHAMKNEFCGYCYFNNVAIGADMIISNRWGKKVLIIDYDVHHGQATQQMFYNRQDVLYFSIHRYEQGTFWPNLKQSNFNYVGAGLGLGHNINVPLNEVGLSDKDYLAIVFHILLPIAYEFNPDYILISGGYDACMGCPEGLMNVTPGFYSHLIALLSGLAEGKIIVALEGGYFVPSLTEGVVQTVKALCGDPCPVLDGIGAPHPEVIETISSVKRMLMPFWKCLSYCDLAIANGPSPEHRFELMYMGEPPQPPFETRACYPYNSEERKQSVLRELETLQLRYDKTELPVCFAYEEKMLLHKPIHGTMERPEKPERITSIIAQFKEYGIYDKMIRIRIEERNIFPFLTHHHQYIEAVEIGDIRESTDIYLNPYTPRCARLAVSTLLTLTDAIFKGKCNIAIGIVRPPGHHAEFGAALGYCFYNNVAAAAKYAMETYNVKKILIVDFDIHHGNGTQNAFYESKNVMYISIHRYEEGKFFPPQRHSNFTDDGHGLGKGFNVNIPFSDGKMGNSEYLAAFYNLVLPLAYAYAPEFVIVSAGFDAGVNDPLGGGYTVSPETFAHFITMLKPLAAGRMLIALEGGYNLTTTSYGMALCAKAALGDPIPVPRNLFQNVVPRSVDIIKRVLAHFKNYWPVLTTYRKLSNRPMAIKRIDDFSAGEYIKGIEAPIALHLIYDIDYVEGVLNF